MNKNNQKDMFLSYAGIDYILLKQKITSHFPKTQP